MYTFSPDGCRVSLGDLTLGSEKTPLDTQALPRVISELLQSASRSCTLSSTQDNCAVYTGQLRGCGYSVFCSSATGDVEKIVSKPFELEICFSDTTP